MENRCAVTGACENAAEAVIVLPTIEQLLSSLPFDLAGRSFNVNGLGADAPNIWVLRSTLIDVVVEPSAMTPCNSYACTNWIANLDVITGANRIPAAVRLKRNLSVKLLPYRAATVKRCDTIDRITSKKH